MLFIGRAVLLFTALGLGEVGLLAAAVFALGHAEPLPARSHTCHAPPICSHRSRTPCPVMSGPPAGVATSTVASPDHPGRSPCVACH